MLFRALQLIDELRKDILGEHESVIRAGLMHVCVCGLNKRQHACMIELKEVMWHL